MLSLELLPAAHGDALWIEYGDAARPSRVLIDGGPARTYANGLRRRIARVPEGERLFELVVVTHIDADHIDGPLIFLQELAALKVRIGELWFNGWDHLPKTERDTYAPLQGEFLGGLIAPGMAFAARSLQETAALLWEVPFAPCALRAGRDTDEALAIGAFHVGVQGILGTVAALLERYPRCAVVVTGGLAEHVARPGWRRDPDWTLRGLAALAAARTR